MCSVSFSLPGFSGRPARAQSLAASPPFQPRVVKPRISQDTLHIIYKSADEPMRRVRLAVCGMLDRSILKENIDGEALLWASRRLLMRGESRKLLIVISDGAPVDQATVEENADKAILDRHLREVIGQIEATGAIELAAIGVKHEVAGYFR